MRLIDADALIDSLNIRSVTYNCIINKCIDDAPTIDAVELVRCKDCKYQDECEEVVLFDINDNEVMGHRIHWCSYGQRR